STAESTPATVRLDVWLWSVRLMPTRSAATTACRGGHVRRNGEPTKASQRIVVGDELRIRRSGRERIVVGTQVVTKRGGGTGAGAGLRIVRSARDGTVVVPAVLTTRAGAPVARTAYADHAPEPAPPLLAAPPRRDRGSGRPTKRERRALDRLRGREPR